MLEVDRTRCLEAAHDDAEPVLGAVAFVEELEGRTADDEATELSPDWCRARLLADEAPVRITTTRSAMRKISSRR
jgi:hypothetical protein